jgi:hypothetical protein
MVTIQLEIKSDKLELFLTILRSLKSDIVKSISINKKPISLDIEIIEKDSSDYLLIQEAKAENNPSYSISEARKQLGL